MDLKVGDQAPGFNLLDENENQHQLKDYLGKKVVVFFYPQDDTPGCTKEACNFRDDYSKYLESDALLLGISPDDSRSHEKFQKKFNLPFTLLADPGHLVCQAYGVWGPKKLFGRDYDGVIRTTFLINPLGEIAGIFHVTRIASHSEKVLEAISKIST